MEKLNFLIILSCSWLFILEIVEISDDCRERCFGSCFPYPLTSLKNKEKKFASIIIILLCSLAFVMYTILVSKKLCYQILFYFKLNDCIHIYIVYASCKIITLTVLFWEANTKQLKQAQNKIKQNL